MLLLLLLLLLAPSCAVAEDPTAGFTAVPLTEAQFPVQKPYDVPLDQRYEFVGGVRRMWVYSTDKPHSITSHTKPRTEIGIKQNYSSGVWQFEGYGYVPSGTTGVSVMQVFGGGEGHATTLMLHVYDGALRYYHRQVVEDGIYDRWFRLNVVHDVDMSNLTVFVDGVQKLRAPGHGGSVHTFKFGVYEQTDPSDRMESRWKYVKVFTKAR